MKQNRTGLTVSIIVVITAGITSTACVTRDQYYNYSIYHSDLPYNLVKGYAVHYEIELEDWPDMEIGILAKTDVDNGITPLFDEARSIYREPYEIRIGIFVKDKVTINKILLHTKDKTIDLHDTVQMSIYGRYHDYKRRPATRTMSFEECSEDEIQLFRHYGIIDFKNNHVNEFFLVQKMYLIYENADISYRRDKKFTLEFDITRERDTEPGAVLENKTFKVAFKRKKYVESFPIILVPVFRFIFGAAR